MLTCTRQCAGHRQQTRTQSHDRSAVSLTVQSLQWLVHLQWRIKATEHTTLHKSWTTPWNLLLGQCALKGGCQGRQPPHHVGWALLGHHHGTKQAQPVEAHLVLSNMLLILSHTATIGLAKGVWGWPTALPKSPSLWSGPPLVDHLHPGCIWQWVQPCSLGPPFYRVWIRFLIRIMFLPAYWRNL